MSRNRQSTIPISSSSTVQYSKLPSVMNVTAVEESISHVAYALSDYSYLVKPVQFGSALEQYIIHARRNVFDQVGKLEEDGVGGELVEQAYAACKKGEFVTLFANSPSSLLQMVPTMYKFSSALLPAVIHVVAKDHSDLMAVRQTGFAMLNSLSAKETEDMATLAHVATLRSNVPFLHVYDGDIAHNELEMSVDCSSSKFTNSLISYQKLAQLIGFSSTSSAASFRELVLSKSTSGVNSNNSNNPSDLYFQVSPEVIQRFNSTPSLLSDMLQELFPHKKYQLFEYFGAEQAEHVVVIMGTASVVLREAIESLTKNWQAKVGVVSVRLYRPWSTQHFLQVIPETVKSVAVLDRMVDDSSVAEPLYMDVLTSFQSEHWTVYSGAPKVLGGIYGHNNTQIFDVVTARTLVEELVAGTLSNGFVVSSPTTSEDHHATPQVGMPSRSADQFEAPYVKMLLRLFESRAVIANLVRSETIWNEKDVNTNASLGSVELENGEFGFGVHLGILAKRQQLKDKVAAVLAHDRSAGIVSKRLTACLNSWHANPRTSADLELGMLLQTEQHNHELLGEIYSLRQYFAPLSQWIVGSEEFSRDVGASGVHQLLKSGENINLLILDTQSSHSISRNQRKRDLGLYAMQYGNAYVASVALYDSYSQVLRALNEADAFEGPSIILAYAPSVHDMESETKEAVSNGYWPLYRYNPTLEDVEGEKAFALESAKIKTDLLKFLQRNNQLSMFAKQALSLPNPSVTSQYQKVGQDVLTASFDALLNGFGGSLEPWQSETKLRILVGSDNGKAEEFATKFYDEAAAMGMQNIEKSDMNDCSLDVLLEDANDANAYVLFVCSTAGQGEVPANAKDFWGELSAYTSTLPLQYAVFGLGDSMYWPREDEKHYFCKAPVDIDAKLSELGASRMVNVAKADDQDADGPGTVFETWKPEFWGSIGIPTDVVEKHSSGAAGPKWTNEDIKRTSNYLRGTLHDTLYDMSTKQVPADDTQITKFHGIYQQDDRDLREQMRLEKKEKAFSFMIRVRVPGGVSTAEQFLMIDQLATEHANANIKLSTRQAYQLAGIMKWDLKHVVRGINRVLMDSLAACGDVNRNVMCTVNPQCSLEVQDQILMVARSISEHLTPRTSAYHEIWIDDQMVAGGEVKDHEPFYGDTYLPRKFKIAIAVPPSNDVDVFAHCLGFIAIIENDQLLGFNVTVGGGMGMTHNNKKTFPRLSDVVGFCTVEQVTDVAEKVMVLQRDHGDRQNRKHARFKYTVEDHGLEWIKSDLERRLGYSLQDPRPYKLEYNGDRFGWHKLSNGKYHYTMFIEGGRVKDKEGSLLRTGLRTIAQQYQNIEFHLTSNQNLSLANVSKDQVKGISAIMQKYKFGNEVHSAMRLNSIACAALPLCGLAFAEAERYLPTLVSKIEDMLDVYGLREDPIVIRMTGCPNGCGRPYLGEIGFVGRAPGIYNMYLGAGFAGDRLNKLYREAVDEEQILIELEPILKDYAENRSSKTERFGDFVIRQGYVKACLAAPNLGDKREPGETFHA